MKNLNITFIILTIILSSFNIIGQPSYIFNGGDGGGFSKINILGTNLSLYKNGSGSGYNQVNLIFYSQFIYFGTESGGYSSNIQTQFNDVVYLGNTDAGYTSTSVTHNNATHYNGGDNDGYYSKLSLVDFVWTGAIGQGWNVSGNWNYNIVPDINRKTIIPTGVPNYPHLNAGLFAIGNNPNNGSYKSGELWIQENALLVTRVQNRIENYGQILIDGNMLVKKMDTDAFTNKEGGIVKISATGSLLIKP